MGRLFCYIIHITMSDLFKRMKKAGPLDSALLSESRFYGNDVQYDTGYPLLNLALSGRLNGGLQSGVTMFAAPSKHFKSNYMCICMAAFQKVHPEGIIIFYDTEGGTKPSYFEAFGIDASKIEHIPVMNLEQLKQDVTQKLEVLTEEDDVFIAVDSLGNIASKKEIADAISGNEAADMTRAKQMKSLGRIITPYLNKLKIPFVGVGHTYETQEMYSKTVMSGGTGLMYISDTVLIIGKSQEKDGKELKGFDFKLTVDKSRFIKEKAKLPFPVFYDGGPDGDSALFDLLLTHTDLVQQYGAWYTYNGDDKKVRKADITGDKEFMTSLLTNDDFVVPVEKFYRLPDMLDTSEPSGEIGDEPADLSSSIDFDALVEENQRKGE